MARYAERGSGCHSTRRAAEGARGIVQIQPDKQYTLFRSWPVSVENVSSLVMRPVDDDVGKRCVDRLGSDRSRFSR